METMLNNIIAEYDLKKDLVIKVNPLYKEELQKNIDEEISKNNLSQKELNINLQQIQTLHDLS